MNTYAIWALTALYQQSDYHLTTILDVYSERVRRKERKEAFTQPDVSHGRIGMVATLGFHASQRSVRALVKGGHASERAV